MMNPPLLQLGIVPPVELRPRPVDPVTRRHPRHRRRRVG